MAKEKRLIDAKGVALAIKFSAKQMVGGSDWIKGYKEGLLTAVRVVEDIGEVDAVEVVRCKDCKHWHEETGWCDKHSHFVDRLGDFCYPEESGDWKMLNADDFCSYGERKDNG